MGMVAYQARRAIHNALGGQTSISKIDVSELEEAVAAGIEKGFESGSEETTTALARKIRDLERRIDGLEREVTRLNSSIASIKSSSRH
jgi:flagellar biosynthesis/type III secretory pathway protein FliH